NRRSVRFAPLAHVEPKTTSAQNRVLLFRRLRRDRSHLSSCECGSCRGHRGHRCVGGASGEVPYLWPAASVSCGRVAEGRDNRSMAYVGRARELAELGRVLDATRAGTGATVLVAGEAGIGKT